MLTLLSPAKKLLSPDSTPNQETTVPQFFNHTKQLVSIMQSQSVEDIAHMMHLSSDLARLNYARYQQFHLDEEQGGHACPALYVFQGDVYQGLRPQDWSKDAVDFSQNHLAILSGLYGLLRPSDAVQPYRLEMGVRLANASGANLYSFWSELITHALNERLEEQENPVLINLASAEYSKAVDEKALKYPMLTLNFYEQKNGALKMIGIHAKKARGLMARYMMTQHIDTLEGIKQFAELGYCFNPKSASKHHFDFVRVHAG